MDAYELAKGLDQFSDLGGKFFGESANMLRQQADRIAELEDRLSMYETKDLDKPQIKELSDAEISEISHRYHYTYNPDYVGFARAILKKASEK
jgi:hypothetical protein